jgi:hypothetical protein
MVAMVSGQWSAKVVFKFETFLEMPSIDLS